MAPTIGPFTYETAAPDTIELMRNDNWTGGTACDGRACLDAVTFKCYPTRKPRSRPSWPARRMSRSTSSRPTTTPSRASTVGRAGAPGARLAVRAPRLQPRRPRPGARPSRPQGPRRPPGDRAGHRQAGALDQTVFPGAPYPDDNPCTNASRRTTGSLPTTATCPSFDVAAANAALDAAGYTQGADGIRVDPSSKLPLVLQNCTLDHRLPPAGCRLHREGAPGDRDQARRELRGRDDGPVRRLVRREGRHAVQPLPRDVRPGGVRLRPGASICTATTTTATTRSRSRRTPTRATATTPPGSPTRAWTPRSTCCKAAIKPADQVQATYRIQQQYIDLVPEIALYYRSDARGVGTRLRNFLKNPSTSSDMWNIQDWWLAP